MRLRLVRQPFDHPDYIFELKHDGFRAIAYLQHGESKLVSSNQRNLGFEVLKRSLAKLPVENAILDGEVICVDAQGVSQFNQLLSRKGEPVFYAFDLLNISVLVGRRLTTRTATAWTIGARIFVELVEPPEFSLAVNCGAIRSLKLPPRAEA